MIFALSAAALLILANAGLSLAARRWTSAGNRDERWGKAQAAAAAGRFVFFAAGAWIVWRWTRAAGPLVAYIFIAAVGQMVLHIYLLNRNKL